MEVSGEQRFFRARGQVELRQMAFGSAIKRFSLRDIKVISRVDGKKRLSLPSREAVGEAEAERATEWTLV